MLFLKDGVKLASRMFRKSYRTISVLLRFASMYDVEEVHEQPAASFKRR